MKHLKMTTTLGKIALRTSYISTSLSKTPPNSYGLTILPISTNLCRFFTNSSSLNKYGKSDPESGFIKKFIKKINLFNVKKYKYKSLGFFLYEDIANNHRYLEIMKKYNLQDTFYSWFVITELHLWIVAVRLMAYGDDGKLVRNNIIEALWNDVKLRSSKLEVASSQLKGDISQFHEQFQAALVGYDEGHLSQDDKVLASVVWRRIFQKDCDEPRQLEDFVQFIRVQLRQLELNCNLDDLLVKKKIEWSSMLTNEQSSR